MVYLILEKEFDPPLSEEQHDREAQALDACLVAHGVRWLRSYMAADRRRMICEFEAADAEAVRSSFRSAGVAFARVWAAHAYYPGGGAQGSWRERREARGQPGSEQASEAGIHSRPSELGGSPKGAGGSVPALDPPDLG